MKIKMLFIFLLMNLMLAGNETIRLATDSYEPYYSPGLLNNGFFSEIAVAAFKEVDIDLQIDFVPWKRAYDLAVSGVYDGLLGAYNNAERDQYFYCTDGICKSTLSIFSKKTNNIDYKNLDSLHDCCIGIVRGYSYTDTFDTDDTFDKIHSPTSEKNINLLFYNRVDVIIESQLVFYNLINSHYYDNKENFVMLGELDTKWLHILFSKNIKNAYEYTQKFNLGLKKIKEKGILDNILKKHGIDFFYN